MAQIIQSIDGNESNIWLELSKLSDKSNQKIGHYRKMTHQNYDENKTIAYAYFELWSW